MRRDYYIFKRDDAWHRTKDKGVIGAPPVTCDCGFSSQEYTHRHLENRQSCSELLGAYLAPCFPVTLLYAELYLELIEGLSWDQLALAAALAKGQAAIIEGQAAIIEVNPEPIAMRIPCPSCNVLHIDEGEFAIKLHHTHACQHCGNVWRPAIVPTVGVRFLPGFKNEAKT